MKQDIWKWLCVMLLLVGAPVAFSNDLDRESSEFPVLHRRLLDAQLEYSQAILTGDSVLLMDASYKLAKRYYYFSDYFESMKWLHKALKFSNSRTNAAALGKIYKWFAYCAEREKDWDAYKKNALISLDFFLRESDRAPLVGAYHTLACWHLSAWKETQKGGAVLPEASLDSARWYTQAATKILDTNRNRHLGAVLNCTHGEILYASGQRAQGLYVLRRALSELESIGAEAYNNTVWVKAVIAETFLDVQDPENARKWILDADRQLAKGSLTLYEFVRIKSLLSRYYSMTQNWKEAYRVSLEADRIQERETRAYMRAGSQLAKLLLDQEHQLAELELSHRELKFQAERAEFQRSLQWLTGAGILAAILGALFFFKLYKKYKSVSIENARLVKEQSHRVKNNLQSVYDLLSIQIDQLSDPAARQALEESMNRLNAVASVHQRLYLGDRLNEIELSAFLPDLIKGIVRSYNLASATQHYEVQRVWLHADEAIPLGLIVSELAINSCKYGRRGGDLSLRIYCAVSADGVVEFEMSDDGPGFSVRSHQESFGITLIGLLVAQLKGSYSFSNENGARFRLHFNPRKTQEQTSEVRKKGAGSNASLRLSGFPFSRFFYC